MPSEKRLLLVALLGSPVAWTVHLLASYLIVAVWCAARWGGVGVAIAVITIVCAGAAVATGVLATRRWHRSRAELAHDAEPGVPGSWDDRMSERGARIVFLSVMSLFLAVTFTFLIILQGLPPFFAPACPAVTMP